MKTQFANAAAFSDENSMNALHITTVWLNCQPCCNFETCSLHLAMLLVERPVHDSWQLRQAANRYASLYQDRKQYLTSIKVLQF